MSGAAERACDDCLARAWLLGRLAGHLDRAGERIARVLDLSDADLLRAVAGAHHETVLGELAGFDSARPRAQAQRLGLGLICRCDPGYPTGLRAFARPPAVLHVAGDLERFLALAAEPPAAIVGTRRPSEYGTELARSLGRGLGAAGVPVLSGMALGVDCAAHAGALAAGAPTIAVLPGGADRPYPAAKHALARAISRTGALVSELPPGIAVRGWMFPARNRVIAALAAITVVVEAGEGSGALITAAFARELGRTLGAVPGRVSSPLAHGPHRLLREGATMICGPQDVLDALYGAGRRSAPARGRIGLREDQQRLLEAIGSGADTAGALGREGFDVDQALAALGSLELAGYVRRAAGGRYTPIP